MPPNIIWELPRLKKKKKMGAKNVMLGLLIENGEFYPSKKKKKKKLKRMSKSDTITNSTTLSQFCHIETYGW